MGGPELTKEQLSELGRSLAAARRQVERNCIVCGTPFVGTTKRRYCSARCRMRDLRRRERETKDAKEQQP